MGLSRNLFLTTISLLGVVDKSTQWVAKMGEKKNIRKSVVSWIVWEPLAV